MKTVIEMAREAGWDDHHAEFDTRLERFAELVRADERNSWTAEMEAMERQVNILTNALAQAKAEEREACANVCEDNATDLSEGDWDSACINCADHIRARGNT